MTAFVDVNGLKVTRAVISGAETGPWWAEVSLEGDEPLTGRVRFRIGSRVLVGTVDPEYAGTFSQQRSVRIVGGANGWSKIVGSRCYHNDAQVTLKTVAQDAARDCGETLATFTPAVAKLSSDFIRQTTAASQVLEQAAGTLSWWVDFDGNTHAGPRATTTADPSKYRVHHYEPANGVAQIGIDELDIWIGSSLDLGADGVNVVRDIEVTITGDKLTCRAVLSPKAGARNMLDGVIRAIVERLTGREIHGVYRYRVLSMGADGRVSLQAVRKQAKLPDLLPVQQWPGAAGSQARLKRGAIVLVQFIEGNPMWPVITHYQGRQGPGWVPDVLTLGAEDPDSALEVAYKGCTVKVLTPPAVFQGSINGLPAVGAVVWPSAFTLGTIETGTPRVKVGAT